jgi:hypothetical protein
MQKNVQPNTISISKLLCYRYESILDKIRLALSLVNVSNLSSLHKFLSAGIR